MYTLWVISGLRVLFVFKRGPSQTLRFSSSVYCVCRHNWREILFHGSFLNSILVSRSLFALWIRVICELFFFVKELFKGSKLPEAKVIYVQIQCYYSRLLGYYCATKYMEANRNGCFVTYHVLFVTLGL